jgi:phage-related protein
MLPHVMAEPTWTIGHYRTPSGGRPVHAFIEGLSKTAQPKVLAGLAMLEQHGNRLGLPMSRAMGHGLHELRVRHPEGPFRILYGFRPGRRVVLLHAFVKRTEQTPKGDLDLARARQRAVEAKEG